MVTWLGNTRVLCGLQANGTAARHVKVEMPPVAKPVPAIASIKAEPVPQTAKGDDGKEFLYATKVGYHHLTLVLPACKNTAESMLPIGTTPIFLEPGVLPASLLVPTFFETCENRCLPDLPESAYQCHCELRLGHTESDY